MRPCIDALISCCACPENLTPSPPLSPDEGQAFLQLAADLRTLQLVLKRLEEEVASISAPQDRGFTAPGAFLFELFAK